MNVNEPHSDLPIKDAIFSAAEDADIMAVMADFYRQLDAKIVEHGPTCTNRGLCCQFGKFGHRLYVTTLEAAYVRFGLSQADGVPLSDSSATANDACPYACRGRCQIREHRPSGCRIFFCEPAAQGWQNPLTETLLSQLRQWHQQYCIPYHYQDWMRVLPVLT